MSHACCGSVLVVYTTCLNFVITTVGYTNLICIAKLENPRGSTTYHYIIVLSLQGKHQKYHISENSNLECVAVDEIAVHLCIFNNMASNATLELIAAAFSAMIGVEVVPPHRAAQLGLPKLSIHQLFRATYIMRPIENANPGEVFDVYVRTLTGARILIQVTNDFTIAEVKAAIEVKEGIRAHEQRLVFNTKTLEDHQTVAGVGITPNSTIFLIVLLRGGGPSFQLNIDELDPGYDYDFTNEVDSGQKFMRGEFEYHRPYGWRRFAIQVLGRKEYGGDNTWLGPGGIRTETSGDEWPVSYHGTSMEYAKKIADQGYKVGSRNLFGKGVYSSPSIEMVARFYTQEFTHDGKNYQVAMQNRVNPDQKNGHLKIVDKSDTGAGADYWVSLKHNASKGIYDIRPYGILIRQI